MTGKRFKPLYVHVLALEVFFKNTPDPFFLLFSLMLQATVESKVREVDRLRDLYYGNFRSMATKY